jgi:hypothetical protein
VSDEFAADFDRAIKQGTDVSDLIAKAKAMAVRPLSVGELGRVAVWYANRGVPVFPLRGKIPLTKRGLNDASTDIAVVREWWRSWPMANIGAATGWRFDVIDVDGPEGCASLAELGDVPYLARVATPRYDGYHLYVAPSPGTTNAAGVKPGIDYRGKGGYVVVPPSIGPNNRRYAWLESPTFLEAKHGEN